MCINKFVEAVLKIHTKVFIYFLMNKHLSIMYKQCLTIYETMYNLYDSKLSQTFINDLKDNLHT